MSGLRSKAPAHRVAPWKGHLAALLVAAPIFAGLMAFAADDDVPAAMLAVGQIIAALAVLSLMVRETPERLWRASLAPALLVAAAAAWAIVGMSLPNRLAPDAASLALLKLVGLFATGLSAALAAQSRRMLHRMALWFAMFGVAYTMFSLWSGQVHPYTVWGEPKGAHAYRFTGTLMNANAAGCVFGMVGLVCLGLMHYLLKRTDLRESSLGHYAALALVSCGAVAAMGACVLTSSRTSLGAMIAIALVVILLEARRSNNRFVLIAASIVLAGGVVMAGGQVVSRWGTLTSDAGLRMAGYEHYASGVFAAPWFGAGLGGFHAWHEAHLTAALAPAMWAYGAVHGALLQAALEGGAPYAVLLTAAVVVAGGQIVATLLKRRRGDVVANALLGAVLLAFICASVDIALNVPAVAALVLALFGTVWGGVLGQSSKGFDPAASEHRDA
jgi:ABC-type transport system involved in multi-copper enzyme maturation permease subunit